MKARWIGHVTVEPIPEDELRQIVSQVLPATSFEQLKPLSGGFRHHNFLVPLKARQKVLRIALDASHVFDKEQRIAELLSGTVATPTYDLVTRVGSRSVALRDFVPGKPLHVVLNEPEQASVELGRQIGNTLAVMHEIQFDRTGDLDEHLEIREPYDLSATGLTNYVEQLANRARAVSRLNATLLSSVAKLWKANARRLEAWSSVPSLTHGDFGPTNLLLGDNGALWVIDWEFSCAGHPVFDFGNLMRPPLESARAFTHGLAESYRRAGKSLPHDWPHLALLADSIAWLQFATRPKCHALVLGDAQQRLQATLRTLSQQ